MQDLLKMDSKWTPDPGNRFSVKYGVMVWDIGVRPSHQAAIIPGTSCLAAAKRSHSKMIT